jgi:hypothetical protein
MVKENLNATIDNLLQGYRFGRYLEDNDLPYEKSFKLLKDNIHHSLKQESTESILISDSMNNLLGILLFRISDWDTLHFRHKTVLIEQIIIKNANEEEYLKIGDKLLQLFLDWCTMHEVKFVVSKTPSLDLLTIHCLEKAGFRFIESWIYNKYDLRRNKTNSRPPLKLRNAEKRDLNYMLKYSKEAFILQRFHADYHIPFNLAESLYAKWIYSAFNDPKQNILVYDDKNIPCAFMIYYIKDLSEYFNMKFVMWKMALINPDMTGKGIGSQFFASLCDYHRSENMDVIDSGLSLRNFVSLNTHNKVNFKIISTLVTMHLWL